MANSCSKAQRALLRAVREEGLLLPEILKKAGVSEKLLARWLDKGYFRKALKKARGVMRRRMWLDLELLANAARATLKAMFRGKTRPSALRIKLCEAILEEFDRAWRRLYSGKRRGKKVREEPAELFHPDAMEDEAELLERFIAREKELSHAGK